MTEFERSPAARSLDLVVDEARTGLDVPSRDWSAFEERVMAAVEAEKPALVLELASSSRKAAGLRVAALGLALAASFAVFVGREGEQDRAPAASARRVGASAIRATEGAGEVRVGGVVATAGVTVHAGDELEVVGARAVLERARKVAWLLEPSSAGGRAQARIAAAADPLVVALTAGAVEAQVAPVATGEAFAVDVRTATNLVRVAVHGTRLRVERVGDRVVVDLTEGVLSIGTPPRSGSTHGRIVNAPAHVELDANDPASLTVVHDPKAVRGAIPLGPLGPALAAAEATPPARGEPAGPAAATPPAGPAKAPSPRPAEATRPPLAPREAIVAAIRDCAAAGRRSGNVQVTATSTLRLEVSADGVVESAQFTPPLSPEIQTCAAATIYKTTLDERGTVTIPVRFSF